MFYCNQCAEAKAYPKSFRLSHGRCEVCGRTADCHDVPHRLLPLPGEMTTKNGERYLPVFEVDDLVEMHTSRRTVAFDFAALSDPAERDAVIERILADGKRLARRDRWLNGAVHVGGLLALASFFASVWYAGTKYLWGAG